MSDKVTKEVDLKVSASGAEKVPGMMARIGESMAQMNREARAAGLSGDSSIFGLLKGGGIAVGAKFAADAMANAFAAAKELAAGEMNAADALIKMGEGIPLVGSLVSMFKEGAGALDAWHDRISGTLDEMRAHKQYLATKGDMAGSDARFGGAMASLGSKAAEIGLDEPEKMRLHARQEWIKTGDEIAKLTKEADLLAVKQRNLYFGAFRDGPGAEDRRREYALVSYQLERERAQIAQMEKYRGDIRSETNRQAAELETQTVSKFYGDLAKAAEDGLQGVAKTAFGFMNQAGAKLMDMKAQRAEELDRFNEQLWRDTKEWQQLQQDARDEWENEHNIVNPVGPRDMTPAPYAPTIQGWHISGGGNRMAEGQESQKEIAQKVDKTNETLRETNRLLELVVDFVRPTPSASANSGLGWFAGQ